MGTDGDWHWGGSVGTARTRGERIIDGSCSENVEPCAGEKCANLFGRFLNDSDVPRVHTKTLGVNMQWVLIFFGARPRSENTTCVIW